jgi:selenocysteine lyase/cysteine desulfurase
MEMMHAWGRPAIVARLAMLTQRLAEGLNDMGAAIPDPHVRAPHILSLSFPHGMPQNLIDKLAAENVYVAPRLGRLRISPHVYNDEEDVDRFSDVFQKAMRTA